jgi:hypothetical protein
MKMADILRDIADLLDQKQSDDSDMDQSTTQLTPVDSTEPELDNNPVMVPPLQAKLEILKKSEGLPNVYDSEGEEDAELAAIKKNAGLTAAQHEASEDNDVLG